MAAKAYSIGTIRGARIVALMVNDGTTFTRRYLLKILPSGHTLEQYLQLNKPVFNNLAYRKKGRKGPKVLSQSQFELLYPVYPITFDETKLDVTLLFIIIRNTSIIYPANWPGWDQLPAAGQIGEIFDVITLKYYRNVLGHNSSLELSVTDFNFYWDKISQPIINLGGNAAEIASKKTAPIDSEVVEDMVSEFNVIADEQKELKGMVQEVHENVDKIHNSLYEIHQDMSGGFEEVKELRDVFETTQQSMREMSEKFHQANKKLEEELGALKSGMSGIESRVQELVIDACPQDRENVAEEQPKSSDGHKHADDVSVDDTDVSSIGMNVLPLPKDESSETQPIKRSSLRSSSQSECINAPHATLMIKVDTPLHEIHSVGKSFDGKVVVSGEGGMYWYNLAGVCLGKVQVPAADVWSFVQKPDLTCYISDVKTNKVLMWDSQRRQWVEVAPGYFVWPRGLALDARGQNLYGLDVRKKSIQIISEKNKRLQEIDLTQATKCDSARYLMVLDFGQIIVSDRDQNCLHILDEKGDLKSTIGKKGHRGSSNEELWQPLGICSDRDYNIYVCDCNNHRIQMFTKLGKYIATLCTGANGVRNPKSICIVGNKYLVVGEHRGIMKVYKLE